MNVVDNIRDEAFQVAMGIGIGALISSGGSGSERLLEEVRKHIFPVSQHEGKELYKEGHNMEDGVLTRQNQEAMQNYIVLLKRWWQLLKQLDPTVQMTSTHLGDMLLDAANIQDWQRHLILTTTKNSTEFEYVSDALILQLGRGHKADRGSATSSYGSRPPYRRPYRSGKGSYSSTANIAEYPTED